ncbi:MAG: hypothetical protein Q9162_007280 [Coniocarpon cinnabarinum]
MALLCKVTGHINHRDIVNNNVLAWASLLWLSQTVVTVGGGNGAFQVLLTGTESSVGSAQDSSDNDDDDGGSDDDDTSNSAPPPALAVSQGPDETTAIVSSTVVSQGPPVTRTMSASTVTASGQSTTLPPSVVTIPGAVTQVVTETPTLISHPDAQQPSPTGAEKGTSTGAKAGIAVGVVIAVLALAAGVGFAVFYFLKKRRNQYAGGAAAGSPTPGSLNRNNTANSFSTSGGFAASGSAPGGWTRNGSVNDSRLDPGMVETRRGSVGSMFDDSEDYSRRVLKVTN